MNYHLSAKKNPNQIDHLGRERIEILNHALPRPTLKSVKSIINYLKLVKMVKMLVKKLFKMVVNVEKLLKMVGNGDFSKFVKKW